MTVLLTSLGRSPSPSTRPRRKIAIVSVIMLYSRISSSCQKRKIILDLNDLYSSLVKFEDNSESRKHNPESRVELHSII
jgi:hypothetical protein